MALRPGISIVNGRIVLDRQTLGPSPQLRRTVSTPPRAANAAASTPDQRLRAELVAAVRERRITPAQANAYWQRAHRKTVARQLAKPPLRVPPPAAVQALEKVPVIGTVAQLGAQLAGALGLDQVPQVDVTNPDAIRHYHDNLALTGDQGAITKYEQMIDKARVAQGLAPFYGSTTALPRAAGATSLGLRSGLFASRTQME